MDKILNTYFTYQGRIGRLTFFLYSLGLAVVYIAVTVLLQFIGNSTGNQSSDSMAIVFTLVMLIIAIVLGYASIMLGIKRFHDLDHSGWWYLLTIVPLVNLLVFIYLLFFKGSAGPNRFGNPPV